MWEECSACGSFYTYSMLLTHAYMYMYITYMVSFIPVDHTGG